MKIEKDETIYLEGDDLRLNHPKLVAALENAARQIELNPVTNQKIPVVESRPPEKRSIFTWALRLATGMLGIS